MLILLKHPEDWQQQAQTQQIMALKEFEADSAETLQLKRNEIENYSVEEWAFVRVVDGLIGLALNGNRVLALEPGDSWLGCSGRLLKWYQEGAVTIEVWHWRSVPQNKVASIIHGFSDLILALFNHNVQVPPDPMPGFKFFHSGDVIIREGESADSVFTLIQGKAKVLVGGVQVGVAKENEILGLQAMLLHSNRTATVIADGSCSAVKVTFDKFRSLIETRPELVITTMETMAQQIDRTNKRLTDK